LKRGIFLKKFVPLVLDHFHGEKNGNAIGMKLSFAASGVALKENNLWINRFALPPKLNLFARFK